MGEPHVSILGGEGPLVRLGRGFVVFSVRFGYGAKLPHIFKMESHLLPPLITGFVTKLKVWGRILSVIA